MRKLDEYKKLSPEEEITVLTRAAEAAKRLLALVQRARLRRKNENK